MTAYTTTASGDWGSAIWSPSGTPGAGDTVTIGHAVAVSGSRSIGTSGATGTTAVTVSSGASLSINAGTFDLRGDLLLNNSPLNLAGGVTLKFNSANAATPLSQKYVIQISTNHNQTSARLNINGTSSQRVTIMSDSGGGNGWINDGPTGGEFLQGGMITGTFVDFIRIGDSSNKCIRQSPTSSASFSLTDATFTNCGRIGGTYNMGATCNFVLRRINMTGTVHATDSVRFENGSSYTSGNRIVDDCVFDKQVHFYTGLGFTVTDTYFADTVDSTAGNWLSCSGCLFQKNDNLLPGGCTNCYFLYTAATDNPHFMQPNSTTDCAYSNNVFEAPNTVNTLDTGDCILLPSVASVTTYTISGNIVLLSEAGYSSGILFNGLGNANWRVVATHNTSILATEPTSIKAALGGLGESFNTAAGQVTSFKSNIGYAASSAQAYLLRNVNGAPNNDVVTAANANYNNAYNVLAGAEGKGYDTPITGSPGANDLAVDPQFFDETRKASKWDISLGGSGTAANAVTELKKRHLSTYNSNYTIASLRSYVRAGFAPTNVSLQSAGHDGVTIGAVEYQAAGNVSSLVPTAQFVISGGSPTATNTSSKACALGAAASFTLNAPGVPLSATTSGGGGFRSQTLMMGVG